MKRLQAIFFCLMLAVAAFADIHVKGTVIDADTSEPMIGVSILVKGTSTGTVTDFDGNFDINVPDKATLQLSYMGYKPSRFVRWKTCRLSWRPMHSNFKKSYLWVIQLLRKPN